MTTKTAAELAAELKAAEAAYTEAMSEFRLMAPDVHNAEWRRLWNEVGRAGVVVYNLKNIRKGAR